MSMVFSKGGGVALTPGNSRKRSVKTTLDGVVSKPAMCVGRSTRRDHRRTSAILCATCATAISAGGLFSASASGQAVTTIIKSDTATMDLANDWGGTSPTSTTIGQFDNTISSGNEAALTLGGSV